MKNNKPVTLRKQVGVRPRTGSGEDKLFIINGINKQPVRLDMTFPETGVRSGKGMITMFRFKRLLFKQGLYNQVQQGHITAALFRKFTIFAILGSSI